MTDSTGYDTIGLEFASKYVVFWSNYQHCASCITIVYPRNEQSLNKARSDLTVGAIFLTIQKV